jgi:MFS transporter, FSR family, fosmidomycin resistance protein
MTGRVGMRERGGERRTLTLISVSHFISHFYMLLLPPLFVLIQGDTGWSYTEISLAIIAFNLTSTLLQTPAGYVSDRRGAVAVLIAGLVLESLAIGAAAMSSSLTALVAWFAVAGIGNTVFHPAHYGIMSDRIAAGRLGGAYAVHTFAGFLGTAAAPLTMLTLASCLTWRGALFTAALAGFCIAGLLLVGRRHLAEIRTSEPRANPAAKRSVLLRPEIVLSLVIFALLAATNSGVQGYLVAALIEAWGTPLEQANAALSAFLVVNALGVLAGGLVSRIVRSQEAFFCAGVAVVGGSVAVFAVTDPGPTLLLGLMAVGGLANGIILPSRDLMVRAATPEGQSGRVFGFVSTGFFIGATVAPAGFALLLDYHFPKAIFLTIAALNLACIALTAAFASRRR